MYSLDLNAKIFSPVNAKACVMASKNAYYLPPDIQSPENHIVITEGPNYAIIAFRGTASVEDFVTDAKCWFGNDATKFKGHIHEGFDAAFNSTFQALSDYVFNTKHIGWKFYFTGHSLGGAQALMAASIFASNHLDCWCYTFGQPRVGNAKYAAFCRSKLLGRHYRFINQEDIVPRIPGLLAGYRHDGDVYFFPSTNGMIINPKTFSLGISDAWGLFKEWQMGRIALLNDHHVDFYANAVNNYFAAAAAV